MSSANLLTAEQEKNLAKKMESEKNSMRVAARNELVSANLGLVVFIAKKYCKNKFDRDDLIQEGSLALMRAAELYNPNIGRFVNYAYGSVIRRIQHEAYKMRKHSEIESYDDINSITADESKVLQPFERFMALEEEKKLFESIKKLDKRKKKIIKMRFGIGTNNATLEKIGKMMGITGERVRQVESEAKKELYCLLSEV